uniref:RING-type E3 ubiquitin transferase (cysteine targeting) n=1 Tax=Albugo laibachii Nc14 TaxID=890382 RepID=F0W1H1_9STRA|nr:peroxisome assembly protein putative [Albugo laibachii Nc14]|eukprot:CCA14900.1 peroxisome assembly protein putative [Albugo laibachii Nc14]
MSCNRVQQRDATILDDEIAGLMRDSTSRLFDKFRPGIVELLSPEVNALIRSFIFTCSTLVHSPTPGMKLQNVQFCQSAFRGRILFMYYVLSIAMPYMWKRFAYFLTAQKARNRRHEASNPKKSSWQSEDFVAFMKRLEAMVSVCQFLNLLIFLRNGCFRSLEERLLGMKLKAIDQQTCMMNFEPITRQQLWQTFTDLGSTFLPVLVYCYRRIANKLQKKHKLSLTPPGDCCLLCGSRPQTPYITSCKHVYCYYCLHLSASEDVDFVCLACGSHFQSSRRLII